jgi:spermidine synthase
MEVDIPSTRHVSRLKLFKSRKESWVIYFSAFVMGSCGIAYEYTLSKIASDLLGHSVRQWAIIIGLMMLFMGIGSDLQKHFRDTNLFDKFIFFEVMLGLIGGLGPILLLFAFGFDHAHYILFQYGVVISIGLLIGFEIPILTRINEVYTHELRVNLGGILKMDYVGAFIGSLVWIFVLPRFFSITQTSLVLGIFNIGVAAFAFLFFRKLVKHTGLILAFIILTGLALSIAFCFSQQWTSYAEQRLYRSPVVLSKTSDYQHIVLTQNRSGRLECFINGRLQFSSTDEYIYHENLTHPAMSIAPVRKDILILGGGDGLALREVLKYPEVESVVLCDIDPEMTNLASNNEYLVRLNAGSLLDARVKVIKNQSLIPAGSYEVFEEGKKHRYDQRVVKVADVAIVNLDAAAFVEQIDGYYDVIIADFPDPNSIGLAKLYSKKFYHHIRQKLSARGIFVQQSTSPFYAKEAFLCIGRTMRASGLVAVPYHDNVPSFGEWGWWICARQGSQEQLLVSLEGLERLEAQTRYLTPNLLKASLVFGKEQLVSEHEDVNTITSNAIYHHYLAGWESAFQ